MGKRISFLVPTTSKNRDWKTFSDTYLSQILLPSISKLHDYDVEVYIGYDTIDPLYSTIELPQYFNNVKLKWFLFIDEYQGKPTWIWNELAMYALNDGHDYFQVCGDDITFDKRTEWLGIFLKNLKHNNNIGYVAGYSNNTQIPTQFLFHKTHLDIFGFIFPPQIWNWYCDNFIADLYGDKGIWIKEYNHLNVGGEPRYTPKNDKQLCHLLVKRYKKVLKSYLK